MQFQPAFCPCKSSQCRTVPGSFQYQRRGRFTRACDGRVVQRFQCKGCRKTFSTQTFRGDYRVQKPLLDRAIFLELVSKVSQRQITRKLHCDRGSVARRLDRLGKHCRDFHQIVLRQRNPRLAWEGHFQLDELETFETDRRLMPVTVPLLVHQPSRCILHAAVGTLAPRKPLPPRKQMQLERIEAETKQKRRSESREKVSECFEVLKRIGPQQGPVEVSTDEKPTYRSILKQAVRRTPRAPPDELEGTADLPEPAVPRQSHLRDAARRPRTTRAAQLGRVEEA